MPTDNLILIPTAFESGQIASQLARICQTNDAVMTHCGFGPAAAAALSIEALINHQPKRVYLLGIAGAYASAEDDLTVGQAYRFATVAIDGIGVGTAGEFQSANELGWSQFAGDAQRPAIDDKIELGAQSSYHLLTVCAASTKADQAQHRQQRYGASAEDMEGFAVAMACRLQGKPLEIIRGISNVAGDRNKSNWQIEKALNSAVAELMIAMEDKE